MFNSTKALLALTVCLSTPVLAASEVDPNEANKLSKVHWQRKTFAPGEWPAEFPARAQALIETWQPWALEMGYRMDLDPDCRVLTLSMGKFNRAVRKEDALIQETLECFDGWFPALTGPQPETGSDNLQEPTNQENPIVLFRLQDQEDYWSLLAFLAENHEYLSEWVEQAGSYTGFVLRQPQCAAWIERGLKLDEWRPENELVNRLTNCLTYVRFGTQPHWLEQGVAWNVELEVQGSIYSFPHRSGFVAIEEHKGWEQNLKSFWGRRKDAQLELEDLTEWNRPEYDALSAGMAWGLVSFLNEHQPAALSSVLRDMGGFHASQGVRRYADGTWELIPDYKIPHTVQSRILDRHLEPESYKECARFFQLGHRYRPSDK